jgi:hypothetical protein
MFEEAFVQDSLQRWHVCNPGGFCGLSREFLAHHVAHFWRSSCDRNFDTQLQQLRSAQRSTNVPFDLVEVGHLTEVLAELSMRSTDTRRSVGA